ncbi:hypothetical protein DVH05_025479 [Phytophthora capsici]|nr:hypothetical protein DVH05_025479 [Phytophthora capsici]
MGRWKASEAKTFAKFWSSDEYGKNAIGADMKGLCVFNALRRAAELAGRPDIPTKKYIDEFAVAGRLLSEIVLKNGVYVAVAYNHESVVHAFVLTVNGK